MFAMSNPYDPNPEQGPYGQYPTGPGQGPGQGQGPGGYGQHPYQGGYGMTGPQPHPQGTVILVLGILGLVVCGIAGVVALVMGNKALKEIDANPAAYNNRQTVAIGRILGIIAVVLWAIGLVFTIIYFIFIGSIIASTPQ
jgi:hypothetical protein